jgi:hypothetical protein
VRRRGLSRRLRRVIVAVLIVVIVLAGAVGYAVAGLADGQARISSANKSLNTVISHQNTLNTTFHDLDSKFNGLSGDATNDPTQARALMDQFVASATSAGVSIDQDDVALVKARSNLYAKMWLTTFSRSNLDREAARVDHARKALADARAVAAGYVQDGHFLQSFIDSAADLVLLSTQAGSADVASARTTLATMQSDVAKALQLSAAPGLPPELHALMVDFQVLGTDFGKLLDAAGAGDETALATAEAAVGADATKLSSYDFNKIGSEINSYYQPLIDGFNAEMALATA